MSTHESSESAESLIQSLMRQSPSTTIEQIQLLQSLWDLSTLTVPEALLLLHLLKEQKLQSLQALYHNPILFRWLCDTERDPLGVEVVSGFQQDQLTLNTEEDVGCGRESSHQHGNQYDFESSNSRGLTTLVALSVPKRPASSDSDKASEIHSSKQEDQFHQISMESEEDDQSSRTLSTELENRRIIKPLPMRHRPSLSTSPISKSHPSEVEPCDSDKVSDVQSSNSEDQQYQLAMELEEDDQSDGVMSESEKHVQPYSAESSSISRSPSSTFRSPNNNLSDIELNQLKVQLLQLSKKVEEHSQFINKLETKPLSEHQESIKKEVTHSIKAIRHYEIQAQQINKQLNKLISNLGKSYPVVNLDSFKEMSGTGTGTGTGDNQIASSSGGLRS